MVGIFGNTLAELEDQLAALRGQQTMPPPSLPFTPAAQSVGANSNGPLAEKLAELRRRTTRTTGKIWDMLKAVAARTQPCTLQDLAQDLGLPQAGSVHSLIAVLGRPCSPKHLNFTVLERIPGNPTRYRMTDEVRAIIRQLG